MSKNKETAIATQTGGALAVQTPRSFVVEGARPELLQMPYVHLHQGDISAKEYGEHDKGSLIHSGSKSPLASRKFVLLSGGWIDYSKPNEGGGWEYKTRNRAEVPEADLKWHGDEPPACVMAWYAPALFVGEESPVAVQIKLTSKPRLNAYSTLVQLESARAKMGKSPLLWEYGFIAKENKQGKWLVPLFKACGDPPADFLAECALWFEAATTATIADPQDDYNPDEL